MKTILLTFDYEIYFDGNNHADLLVSKTNEILKKSQKYNCKLVFFVDVYYLIKLKEFNLMKEYETVLNQLFDIKSMGHEIQFHFHPHWIHAKHEDSSNTWTFDKSEYSLSDIYKKYGHDFLMDKLTTCLNFYKNTLQVDVTAYRAGGLSIDKNQSELIHFLNTNGILYDSSVLPGLYLKGKYIESNHQKAPQLAFWKLNENFFEPVAQGNIIEIPIMCMHGRKVDFLQKKWTSIQYRLAPKKDIDKSGKGQGKAMNLEIEQSHYPQSITFDKSSKRDIILFKFFTKQYLKNGSDLMCILSHPKSFVDESFEAFDMYLNWLKKNSENHQVLGFNDLKLN